MAAGARKKRERDRVELGNNKRDRSSASGDITARMVNTERRRSGQKRTEFQVGAKPAQPLRAPIPNYDRAPVADIAARLGELSKKRLEEAIRYEERTKNRKTLLRQMQRELAAR